jgi:hypothetical protein
MNWYRAGHRVRHAGTVGRDNSKVPCPRKHELTRDRTRVNVQTASPPNNNNRVDLDLVKQNKDDFHLTNTIILKVYESWTPMT